MGFLKPVNPAKYPYIAKTPGRRAAPGGVHHGRAEIGGDDLALRADALGGQKACLAGDRRKFQDRPAGSGTDLVDEPFRDAVLALEETIAVMLPCGGEIVRPLPRPLARIDVRHGRNVSMFCGHPV